MKKLLLLLTLTVGCLQASTLLVSDFSSFAPLLIQPQPLNPADGPWSEATALAGATDYAIGDFGTGTPSGLIGNGFIQYLSAAEDWSSFSYLTLTGSTASSNATPFLSFYLEDANLNVSSVNVFDLVGFAGGATVSLLLDLSGVDATQIAAWGFVTNEADTPAFGFTFDNLALSTEAPPVPDAGPGLAGLLATLSLLGFVRARRPA